MVVRAQSPENCPHCGLFCSAAALTREYISCDSCGKHLIDISADLNGYCWNRELFHLLPLCLCRENKLLPFLNAGNSLVVVADFYRLRDADTGEKIRFILNRDIQFLHAASGEISEALAGIQDDTTDGLSFGPIE